MIPHERTRLTAAEQETLRELERSLERGCLEPEHQRNWPFQLAGVIVVAVSALVAGVVASPMRNSTILLAAMIAIAGLMIGGALAIDPVRRFMRTIPARIGIASWRRRRLARQVARAAGKS